MLIFDLFMRWKKIMHSIRRSIVGKRRFNDRVFSCGFEDLPKKLPKIIWIYWNKPIEDAPSIVHYAVDTWVRKNPSWDVRVLSDASVADFVDIPPHRVDRKIQWRADLIRMALLRDYGGVWVDATTFCARPLEVASAFDGKRLLRVSRQPPRQDRKHIVPSRSATELSRDQVVAVDAEVLFEAW
jgi:mannosyltransferase OCH1-like enzyme